MIYGTRGLETWEIYGGIPVIEWGYKTGLSATCIFLRFVRGRLCGWDV